MSPGELLNAALCYCGVAVAVVFTLALCGVFVVAFVLAAGWLVTSIRGEGSFASQSTYPDGTPQTIVRFPTGQVGVMPTPNGAILPAEPVEAYRH
jgi:hypothetical protein